ncbi:MAG: ribosome biogenesis GTPase Der [Desulfovibrionaceae bacterium]|nr:ribosome biogenesis GTPase Der [Desulfovibrionaceae bacterium]
MEYVALLGRPNVGKSTLFNKLIRSNRAITHDIPGVTRDRIEGIVRRYPYPSFKIIDTGGVTLDERHEVQEGPLGIQGFEHSILQHAIKAIEQSSVLCLVVDGKAGLHSMDKAIAEYIRVYNKPVLIAVNKVDGVELEDKLCSEFYELGFPLLGISAEHNVHLESLVEQITSHLSQTEIQEEPYSLKIALLGRPNVGKSSFINALLGEERMIVQDYAGTTRDSVDVTIEQGDEKFIFVDTAGVRKRGKIEESLERFSVNASIKSTTKSDISLLIVDAVEGITQQDKRLLALLYERKLPCIVVVNKIDCIQKKLRRELEKDCEHLLSIASTVPIRYISALTKEGIDAILPLCKVIHNEMSLRVPTGQLNRCLEGIVYKHQPPIVRNSRPRFFYMTQPEINPPTFVIFVSDSTRILDSYARYVEKHIRETFGIDHAPIRLHFRSSHTPRKRTGRKK